MEFASQNLLPIEVLMRVDGLGDCLTTQGLDFNCSMRKITIWLEIQGVTISSSDRTFLESTFAGDQVLAEIMNFIGRYDSGQEPQITYSQSVIDAINIFLRLKDRYPNDYEGSLEDTYRRFKLFSVACPEGDQVCGENMNDETYRTNLVWLQAKVEENPWFLFGECIEDHPKWPQWRNLILFDANSVVEVSDRLDQLTEEHYVQSINNAVAPIMNMDYFSVEADDLPTVYGQQDLFTNFEYYRKNLNSDDFVGGEGGCPNTDFRYLLYQDQQSWLNGNVLGTVFSIQLVPFGLDDGAVIASQYDYYPVEQKASWTFSTVHQENIPQTITEDNGGTQNDGYHPVSGNRQFGFFANTAGKYEYFTMGADRITTWWQLAGAYAFSPFHSLGDPYSIADPVWHCLQDQIEQFLDNKNISSTKNNQKLRPGWTEIFLKLKNESIITELPCYNE